MSYIGKQPLFGDFIKLDSIKSQFNGTLKIFTLKKDSVTEQVGAAEQLIVVKNGLLLEPKIDFDLSESGTQISFTTAPINTDNVFMVLFGSVFNFPTVAANTISTNKIQTGAVTNTKIADDSISTAKLQSSSVTSDKIQTGAVTHTKIADSSITLQKIVDGAVTNTKIADDSISTAKLQSSSVTSDKIQATQSSNISVATGETATLNFNTTDWQKVTSTGTTFTLAFTHSADKIQSMILECVNFGGKTISWPSGMKWQSSSAPTFTTGGTDHIVIYKDKFNNFYGSVVGINIG